jgi:Zn-finger nucleic acid-binding protein
MSHNRDDLADALSYLADDLPPRDGSAPVHGDRPCPICGQLMLIETVNAIEIDTCPAHGIWLDHEELESIIATAAPQRRPESSQRVAQMMRNAKREGKAAGAMLGVWALLLPD